MVHFVLDSSRQIGSPLQNTGRAPTSYIMVVREAVETYGKDKAKDFKDFSPDRIGIAITFVEYATGEVI